MKQRKSQCDECGEETPIDDLRGGKCYDFRIEELHNAGHLG